MKIMVFLIKCFNLTLDSRRVLDPIFSANKSSSLLMNVLTLLFCSGKVSATGGKFTKWYNSQP